MTAVHIISSLAEFVVENNMLLLYICLILFHFIVMLVKIYRAIWQEYIGVV